MVERAILESHFCSTEGPSSPPVEKNGVNFLSISALQYSKYFIVLQFSFENKSLPVRGTHI